MMAGENMHPQRPSLTYEIQLQGLISQRWIDWFGNMQVTAEQSLAQEPLTTVIVDVVDQSALLGLLQKLHNLGYPLLQVTRRGDTSQEEGSDK